MADKQVHTYDPDVVIDRLVEIRNMLRDGKTCIDGMPSKTQDEAADRLDAIIDSLSGVPE